MRRGLLLLTAVILLSLTAAPLLAQSRNTGAIRGVVTDETGGRIPGVVVELQSPDYIGGVHAMTTDKNGSYRFTDLPPGTYTLRFSIEGYQKVERQAIRLEATKTLDLDVQLTARGGEETIVVSGQSPLVDLASSATPTTLSEDYLQNLPTTRTQIDVLNLAPGINDSAAFGGGGSSANAYQIDGVDVSDPEGGTPFAFFNFNLMKEVQLVGLGAPAEYGGFTGVVFNSVTKSGSNDFSGLVDILNVPKSLVAKNTDDPDFQPPSQEKFYDTTAQVGGPFIKDKLWYFFSAQLLQDDSTNGGPLRTERDPRFFGKLTWQMNANNSLEVWGEYDRFDITGRGGDAFTPLEATVKETAPEWDWNFSWRSVLSPNTTLNMAYTGWYGYYYLDPTSGYSKPGHVDSNGFASQNSSFYYLADRYRHVLNATISHYSDTFLTGKHDFKYGVEFERSRVRSRDGYPGGAYYYDLADPNGAVYYSYAYLGYSYDLKAVNTRLSGFVQDSWQINDRWTVNPGVRVDFNRGSVPGSANIFRTVPLAPRIGFNYDLTGKKKTILKAHYGVYYEALFGNYFEPLTPGAYTQKDVYGFDPTTTTFDRNNPDPSLLLRSELPKKVVIDHDLKHPQMNQYTVGIDHDFGNDFAVSGALIYRKTKNFIETVSLDGDFTKVKGFDPVTGKNVTLFDQGNINDTLIITNPSGLEREYKGGPPQVHQTADQAMAHRSVLLAHPHDRQHRQRGLQHSHAEQQQRAERRRVSVPRHAQLAGQRAGPAHVRPDEPVEDPGPLHHPQDRGQGLRQLHVGDGKHLDPRCELSGCRPGSERRELLSLQSGDRALLRGATRQPETGSHEHVRLPGGEVLQAQGRGGGRLRRHLQRLQYR